MLSSVLTDAMQMLPSAVNSHIESNKYKYMFVEKPLYNTFKKNPKFKSRNTTPGEQKGEVIVYSVQQPLNLILYRSKFTSIQY